jgi:hypothetical protein
MKDKIKKFFKSGWKYYIIFLLYLAFGTYDNFKSNNLIAGYIGIFCILSVTFGPWYLNRSHNKYEAEKVMKKLAR